MALYGLQADINENPNRNIRLYVPGQTNLNAMDVFLGGPGTGVTEKDLNGAARVYGNTAKDTSKALDEYTSDLASQIQSAIANNSAPRPDSYMGMPTMQRQQMEIGQANSQIQNKQNEGQLTGFYNDAPTLAMKQYQHNVSQDNFNNGINVGQLMGEYDGQQTLPARAQAIQNAQFNAQLGQDNSQFNQKLASDIYSQYQKANTPSASDITRMNLSSAMQDVQTALDSGTSPDDVKRNIISRASDYQLNGITPSTLLQFVDSVTKTWGDSGQNPNVTNNNAMAAWNYLQTMK